jgi:hypothetical protein
MTQTVILCTPLHRTNARLLIDKAPPGSVVKITPPTRSSDQNAKMWAMLSEISRAKPEGRSLVPEKWKCLFMDAIGKVADWEPGIDGGVVNVGYRSSRLTKDEMSELIECISEYAARHGIALKEAA